MATKQDFLSRAVRNAWSVRMTEESFVRTGRRNFVRLRSGILSQFDFQVSSYGSRDFCINVWISTAASRTGGLSFRLKHPNGAELWLGSATEERANHSASEALEAAINQAFPVIGQNATPSQHADMLRRKHWGSMHHHKFAVGVAELLSGNNATALKELQAALALYEQDFARVSWAKGYADQALELIEAMNAGCEAELLDSWAAERAIAVGLRA